MIWKDLHTLQAEMLGHEFFVGRLKKQYEDIRHRAGHNPFNFERVMMDRVKAELDGHIRSLAIIYQTINQYPGTRKVYKSKVKAPGYVFLKK